MDHFLSLLVVWLSTGFTNLAAPDDSPVSPYILSAVKEAKMVIDAMYKYSREESLARVRSSSARAEDVLRLLKQPARDTRSAVRAADYMDYTLKLIQKRAHHVHKRSLNATDLLTPEDLATIARLTGCASRLQPPSCRTILYINKYRTATGVCNNMRDSRLGSSNSPFTRWLPAEYQDGFSLPQGWDPSKKRNGFLLPLVRMVSNQILATANEDVESDKSYTHLLTMFGQWMDHDLTFTPSSPSIRSFSNGINCDTSCEQTEPCFPIKIPTPDPSFNHCIPFFRSAPGCGTGPTGFIFGASSVRQQMNSLSAFLDVEQVYGSEEGRARELRDFSNNGGLLRVNQRFADNGRELLPFSGMAVNFCATRRKMTNNNHLEEVPCFIAGDFRADENIGLTSMHTLMMREHNRLTRALRQLNPQWGNEMLYQEARKIMGGYHQVITFRDYLLHIVGPVHMKKNLSTYPGYDEKVDPSISNVFATAAFRFAHLTVQPFMFRLDTNYKEHPQFPSVPLHKALIAPWRLIFEGGIDPVLRGLVGRPAKLNTQAHMMPDELRERLFQFVKHVALDLASLNLQRGRDHGLPGYNAWRRFCGLSQARNENELAKVLKNKDLAKRLIKLYRTPDNIDVWMGGIAEPFVHGGRVGPLFACLIARQFQRIRQGDRLWWENDGIFTQAQRKALANVSLARIICDNTGITEVPSNPFLFRPRGSGYTSCRNIPSFDLTPWTETRLRVPNSITGSGGLSELKSSDVQQDSAFKVRLGYNIPHSSQVIIFREVIYNGQNLYSTQDGVFTCQVAGVYQFDFHSTMNKNVGTIEMRLNGQLVTHSATTRHNGCVTASGGTKLQLRQDDRVWLQADYGSDGLATNSVFSGHLLFTT